jgi:hypothetical protein
MKSMIIHLPTFAAALRVCGVSDQRTGKGEWVVIGHLSAHSENFASPLPGFTTG